VAEQRDVGEATTTQASPGPDRDWAWRRGIGLPAALRALRHRDFRLFFAGQFVSLTGTTMVQMGSANTLIQAMVPDDFRGRVMAVYSMMFMGMAPFGALLAGMLAGAIGAPATVAAGGLACLAGAAAFGTALPSLRPEGRRLLAESAGTEVVPG
jgi:MFS family permease